MTMMRKLSSLYLHYPFCKHLCPFCDFYKLLDDSKTLSMDSFHHQLDQSLKNLNQILEKQQYKWSELKTIYIGGGTPSLWDKKGAVFLEQFFKKHHLKMAPNVEFTMELDPGAWSKQGILAFDSLGVNRFSVGIQCVQSDILKAIDRSHGLEESFLLLDFLKQAKLNFSVDLMLGLPFSKEHKRDITQELKTLLDYGAQHVSLYHFTVAKNYPLYDRLPDDQYCREEYLKACEFLKKNAFTHYEVSNFARSGYQSRHNQAYWSHLPMGALGPSATGFLPISSDLAWRLKSRPLSDEYDVEVLNREQIKLEKIYLNFRTQTPVNLEDYFLDQKTTDVVEKWEKMDYLRSPDPLQLSDLGLLMLDSLMDDLFSLKSRVN